MRHLTDEQLMEKLEEAGWARYQTWDYEDGEFDARQDCAEWMQETHRYPISHVNVWM